jgi:transcriptional regulator with XRE-family HTH domain
MTPLMVNISKRMELKGFSQADLAKAISKPKASVNSWFTRELEPKTVDTFNIAKALGTTVECLVSGEEVSSVETSVAETEAAYGSSKIQMLIDKAKRLPADKIDVLLQVADGFLPADSSANSSQNAG